MVETNIGCPCILPIKKLQMPQLRSWEISPQIALSLLFTLSPELL